MLNQVVLVGRITKDPEVRETDTKVKVTNITIAVPRSYKNKDGEYDTDFIQVTIWKQLAENTVEYCKKGDLVGVKAHLQNNNYTDKEGNKRYDLQVVAEKITFLSSKKEESKEN